MADYSRVSSLEKRLQEPSFKKSGSIIPKKTGISLVLRFIPPFCVFRRDAEQGGARSFDGIQPPFSRKSVCRSHLIRTFGHAFCAKKACTPPVRHRFLARTCYHSHYPTCLNHVPAMRARMVTAFRMVKKCFTKRIPEMRMTPFGHKRGWKQEPLRKMSWQNRPGRL